MLLNKGAISRLLRSMRLMHAMDFGRFYVQKLKNRKLNQEFKRQHPDVPLPSDYLLYEAFQLHYDKYYNNGFETAKWLVEHLAKHIDLKNINILDWGCGPGRIIRHLPQLTGKGCQFFGTDYNKRSIAWCAQHLGGIQFNQNPLSAHLPYEDDSMDVIYGISILTHLSEQLQYDWSQELLRVLRPGGILFLTTQGDNFKGKLTHSELSRYMNDEVVIRGHVQVGHRTFSAFHPKGFMHTLFSNATIVEHLEPTPTPEGALPQAIWIVRKP